MAANTQPRFTLTPLMGAVNFSTANTNRDGSGALGTVCTAGAEGSRVDMVHVKATGTTTAGMVRLYYDGGAGALLLHEFTVSAITPSASTAAWEDYWIPPRAMVFPSGGSLKVSTHNAESFNAFAFGGSF